MSQRGVPTNRKVCQKYNLIFMKTTKSLVLIWLGLFLTAGFALASGGFSPEAKQTQLDWNMKTTVDAYKKVGKTDAKWDEPTMRALTEFATHNIIFNPLDEPSKEIIRTNCDAAIKAGCIDPMVRYLYVRYSLSQTNSPQVIAEAYCGVALDMEKSSYPDIRKFFAALRAIHQTTFAYGYTNVYAMETVKEISRSFGKNLTGVLQDKMTPPEDVYEACAECLNEFRWNID
jgi:hypothetical protein